MRLRGWVLGFAVLLALPLGAQAQTAGRTITIVVPFTPGTGPDILARTIGEEIQRRWNQPVVVDNKPGASGNIGTQIVARAAPDGHTLLMTSNPFTANISLFKDVPYDPIKSFTVITKLVDSPYVLLVNPKVPARNVQEFVALAKAAPETIHYASSGNGSAQHLMGGLFVAMTGAPLKHVPYRGSSGAATDLVAGVVESSFAGVPNALAQVPQGRLKALAVTTAKRIPQLPDVPTLQEAGVPGYEASVWLALLAPAGTPPEIVNRLNAEVAKLMNSPETRKALFDAGVEPTPSTPQAMSDYMVQELARWGKVVKDTGVKLE